MSRRIAALALLIVVSACAPKLIPLSPVGARSGGAPAAHRPFAGTLVHIVFNWELDDRGHVGARRRRGAHRGA